MSKFLSATPERVQDLLVKVFERITGLPPGRVLMRSKIDRRPAEGLYCTLYFKSAAPLRQDSGHFFMPKDPDYDKAKPARQHLKNTTRVTVEVCLWGEDAFYEAVGVQLALQAAQRFTDLWRVIGYSGTEDIQDSSVDSGGHIQQRAFFLFNFYVQYFGNFPADWFDHSHWRINDEDEFIIPEEGPPCPQHP